MNSILVGVLIGGVFSIILFLADINSNLSQIQNDLSEMVLQK
jgi:hypothetical protein